MMNDRAYKQEVSDRLLELGSSQTAYIELAQDWFMREGIAVVPHLATALEDPVIEPIIKARILRLLGKLQAVSAVETILRAVDADDSMVRHNAIDTLGVLGTESAVKGLVTLLAHHDVEVVKHTVDVLGNLKNPVAIPPLENLLKHTDSFVKFHVIQALAKFEDEKVKSVLQSHLLDFGHPEGA